MGKSNRYIRIVRPFLSRVGLIGGLFLGLWIAPVSAQMSLQQRQANLASFEQVWTTIRDQHWDPKPGGLDWEAIGAEFRPKMERAATIEDARAVLREMLGRLKQTHFAIFPGGLYADLESAVGGEGWPGFEVQVIDGHALVSGGSVIPWGWEVVSAGGTNQIGRAHV